MIDIPSEHTTDHYEITIFQALSLLLSQVDCYLFLSILVSECIIKIASVGLSSTSEIDPTKIYHLGIDRLLCQDGIEYADYLRGLICRLRKICCMWC